MSTLKVDSITNDGSAVDFTYNVTMGNGTLKKEYYEQATQPAYPCDGALWFNTSNDTFHVYANNAWLATTATQVVLLWYGARGVISLGYVGGYSNRIDYITIATAGNATDFGDRTTSSQTLNSASFSNGSRGIFAGAGTNYDVIEYFTIANPSNTTDFGDLTVARNEGLAGCSNTARGLIAGGQYWSSGWIKSDIIDYVTIATTGNATDFGNLTAGRVGVVGVSNGTRGIFAGGTDGTSNSTSADHNTIEYVTIDTTGNAQDFGDLTQSRYNFASCGSLTRGVFAGGRGYGVAYNNIDYITMATTGNATDFGDLTENTNQISGTSDISRGVFSGGSASSYLNTIQYITIATTGNTTDFGDLTAAAFGTASCSGT